MIQKGEKIAIWGSGITARKTYCLIYKDYKIVCFYDNDKAKWGTEVYGISVKKYTKKNNIKIIISSIHWKEIAKQLTQSGLTLFRDFIPYCFLNCNLISYEELFNQGYNNIPELIHEIKGTRKIAVLYGNCQIAILTNILLLENSFSEHILIVKIPAVCEYTSKNGKHKACWDNILNSDEFWSQISLFIYQKVAETNRFSEKLATSHILKKLPESCKTVEIVNIYFSGYFLQAAKNLHNFMDDIHQAGLFPYSDINIDKMTEQGLSEDKILEEVEREDFFSLDKVHASIQESLAELKRREETADVAISDYITENYAKRQLFYSPNHPTNEVLAEYTRRILEFLGAKHTNRDYVDETDIYISSCCLKGQDIPIYPSVIKILQMQKYEKRYYPNRYLEPQFIFSFREYYRNYIKYCFDRYKTSTKENDSGFPV